MDEAAAEIFRRAKDCKNEDELGDLLAEVKSRPGWTKAAKRRLSEAIANRTLDSCLDHFFPLPR